MSRPTKQTVEYFPHYVKGTADSRTKFILEHRWGNDGYAFWFKLLELLCKTEGHAYYLKEASDWEYFIANMNVDDPTAKAILDKLSDIGKIDPELWEKSKIIWCDSLINNLKSVYAKRTISLPEKPKIKVSATKTAVSAAEIEVFDNNNPQSKVKDSTEKENTPSMSPPAPQEDEEPPVKKTYGTDFKNVKLTDDEYGKLVQRLGKDSTADYIDRLDGWLAEGHRKKNHYATILNWWRKDNPQKASYGSVTANGKNFKPSRT